MKILLGISPTLFFRRAKIVPGDFLYISLLRRSKLNSDTRAMGRFSDVAWCDLIASEERGRKDS